MHLLSQNWHLDVLHKYSSIDEQGSRLGMQSRGSRDCFFTLSLHIVSLFVHHPRLMDTQSPDALIPVLSFEALTEREAIFLSSYSILTVFAV